jgi:large subunit ribosomal protein L1
MIVSKRTFKSWIFNPELANQVALIRAHYSKGIATNKSSQKIDNGLTLSNAISKIKDFSSSNPRHNSARISLNLVCKLMKSTNNGFRGFITLPTRISKEDEAVLVFCPSHLIEESKAAGAKFAGGAELMNDIVDGKIKFTKCVATPDMIGVVTKLARILGPLGLMPNMKHGTLTNDVNTAITKCLDNLPYFIVKQQGTMNLCLAKL